MSATVSTDEQNAGTVARLSRARPVAATAMFIALSVALGFLLAPVPNVELVTLSVFVSGVLLGPGRGAVVGSVAMALYSGFSPNGSGAAIPPMYAAQIVAMGVAGLAGGVSARFWTSPFGRTPWRAAVAGAVAGVVLTALYQSLVIVGLAIAAPEFNEGFFAVLVANAFFSTIHLVSNAVIFAVVGPALLAKVARPATSLLVLAAIASVAAQTAGAQELRGLEPYGGPDLQPDPQAQTWAPSPEDTLGVLAAMEDTAYAPPTPVEVPEPGNDIRVTRSDGPAALLARERGVRLTGVGWRGQAASVARGALPATLTATTLDGRPLRAWPGAGLGLTFLTEAGGRVHASASGPDLSLWTTDEPSPEQDLWSPGRPVVAFHPWLAPLERPYARFTMRSGDPGRRGTSFAFGRGNASGTAGLSAFFESEEGRAPVSGGSFERDAAGGLSQLVVPGGPSIDVVAQRTRLERGVPSAGDEGDALVEKYVVSTVDASGSLGGVRLGLFHDEGWADVREPGYVRRSLELKGDGAYCELTPDSGPFDALDFSVASAAASGTALLRGERRLEIDGRVKRTVPMAGAWDLDLSAGWSQSYDSGYPSAFASLDGSYGDGRRAFVALAVDGRHATALEREGAVAGASSLGPEMAVSLSGGWDGAIDWASLSARAELARILGAVSSRPEDDMRPGLRNAPDETAAAVSVGVSTVAASNPGAHVVADVTAVDPDGALMAREPVPLARVVGSVWFDHHLFANEYVAARWELGAVHEVGRARGPWDGLMGDSATTVSVCFTAAAGSAKVYVQMDDILDAAPERVPGFPGPGRSISAGFSWRFWD